MVLGTVIWIGTPSVFSLVIFLPFYNQFRWNVTYRVIRGICHSLGWSWKLGVFSWTYTIWLVVWNINFILPYIGDKHPNWLSYFSEGLKPLAICVWFLSIWGCVCHYFWPLYNYFYMCTRLVSDWPSFTKFRFSRPRWRSNWCLDWDMNRLA